MSTFKFILDTIIPPILILTGLINNLLVIAVYSRKKFQKLSTKNVWRLLAFVDIISIFQITKYFTKNSFSYNLYLISAFTCKLVSFLSHIGANSAWLVVYISCQRLCSIISSGLNKFLHKFQSLICCIIIAANISFYCQRFIYTDLMYKNSTNLTSLTCTTRPEYIIHMDIFKWIDTVISTIVPFFLMLICSSLLIYTVFKSRRRMTATNKSNSTKANRSIARDIKFSMTLILLNFVFVIFKLPVILYITLKGDISSVWFSILDDLYYSCFAINFYIYLGVNSIFCDEFLVMFNIRKMKSPDTMFNMS